ncbi:MAG: hypothetical protein IPN17_38850 [Deltaproteobacteria bacterium]|nr:hypothetical protein [Deltaproteobacteria bacterium]
MDSAEEVATARFLGEWKERYNNEHLDEFEAAIRETGFALLGRTFTRDDGPGLSPHLGTSLVPTWTSSSARERTAARASTTTPATGAPPMPPPALRGCGSRRRG